MSPHCLSSAAVKTAVSVLPSLGVGVQLLQGGEDDEAPPPLSSVMSL